MVFPGGSDGKESVCSVGDQGLIPGLGRSPQRGHGNPFQDFCLKNPMDKEAWWATVHRVAQSWTRLKQLSMARHIVDLQAFLVAQWFKKIRLPMQEAQVRFLGQEDPLEKEMATHFSILA